MANSIALGSNYGGNPSAPTYTIVCNISLDTYTTGGISIDALLAANPAFVATKLPITSVISGYVNLDAAAGSLDFDARFIPSTRKIVLVVGTTGAEQANGAIGATATGTLTLIVA